VEDKPCIWVAVYERAKAAGRLEDLQTYVPPPHRELKRTSSWVNYFLERDSRPGNFIPLAEFSGAANAGKQKQLSSASAMRTPNAEGSAVKTKADRR
jgi:hypothetical protein